MNKSLWENVMCGKVFEVDMTYVVCCAQVLSYITEGSTSFFPCLRLYTWLRVVLYLLHKIEHCVTLH